MTQIDKTLIQCYPLERSKILKKTLQSVLMIIPVAMIAGIILLIVFGSLAAFFAAIIGLLMIACAFYYYETLYYNNYFYDLTKDGLVIGKGVFGKWRITVPPHKIQDMYIDQDIFDQVFGLYDLHLSTATDVSAREAHIDGLNAHNAEEIRTLLMKWVSAGTPATTKTAEGEELRPSPSSVIIPLLSSFISGGILLLIFAPPLLILLPILLVFSYLDFSVLRYRLKSDGVFVRSGFFAPSKKLFLYRNIQDVEDTQDLLNRIFGFHTLRIKTMTSTSAASGVLAYLDGETAKKVREEIILRSKNAAGTKEQSPLVLDGKMSAKKERFPVQDFKELVNPFKNNFIKQAHYSVIFFSIICISALVLLILIQNMVQEFLELHIFLSLGLPIIGLALIVYFSAIINDNAYSYTIKPDCVQTDYNLINTKKKQMFFSKLQDIEKSINFSDSFAKLANLKFETGSKEYFEDGKNGRIVSQSTFLESIPALNYTDADSLKLKIAELMGISLTGIGSNPLVQMFPLSMRKPLKKTFELVLIILGLLLVDVIAIALSMMYAHAIVNAISAIGILIFIIGGLAVAFKYWYELEYYKKYYYDMNGDVLVIRKGVFGSRELTVPFRKIQDVFVDRDLLDVVFGLHDVYISTVTDRSIMNAHIDGVDSANAEKLAEQILTGL